MQTLYKHCHKVVDIKLEPADRWSLREFRAIHKELSVERVSIRTCSHTQTHTNTCTLCPNLAAINVWYMLIWLFQ